MTDLGRRMHGGKLILCVSIIIWLMLLYIKKVVLPNSTCLRLQYESKVCGQKGVLYNLVRELLTPKESIMILLLIAVQLSSCRTPVKGILGSYQKKTYSIKQYLTRRLEECQDLICAVKIFSSCFHCHMER